MYIYTYILKGVMFIGKIQSWVNRIGYASNEWQFEILYRVVRIDFFEKMTDNKKLEGCGMCTISIEYSRQKE